MVLSQALVSVISILGRCVKLRRARYRMAEANHHQYVSHLALNYVVADVIATCLNRHLPSSHAIYKYGDT